MNSFDMTKYKDELPTNTITKIKKILYNLGIYPIETNWNNSAKGFYSVSVVIKDTNLSTNGKGTTPLYALASAYGEMMERLQNQSFFKLSIDLSPQALQYRGFYYAPDEKKMSINEVLNSKDDWVQIQMSKVRRDIDKRELLKKWKDISYENTYCDFVALPYLNLTNSKLSYIPIKMISKMYMSNGMCAGNTIEEALVQGLSEVFERAVNKAIVLDKIIPPTIPRDYIMKFPRIEAMIREIESSGNYKILVKDCSLDKSYPVVGVIFIDQSDQTYFIKFGSHPMFEVALERTLTELLQGQNIRSMKGVKEFSYKNPIDNEDNNLMGILVNGSGYYPTELFNKKSSYEFKGFKEAKGWSNKEMLNYLVNLLRKEGYDIFVRDSSYLGFPSYHIIVPELSEIEKFDDIDSLEEYADFVKMKNTIRNLQYQSNEEIEELLHLMKKRNIGGAASIPQFLNIQTKNIFPWYYGTIDLFITAAYYKIGDFENSYKNFDNFLKTVSINPLNKGVYNFYKCVRDYIGTRADNLSERESINILSTFYPLSMINKVTSYFKNEENIFTLFGQLKCWNCNKCDVKGSCSYDRVEKVYKILKYNYSITRINQYDMKNLLFN
ncbi:YcaO-like family protein [Clostridium combesii]|uniref:YcaO domain-containing protein n=1 Tax=Clostridium combesii TaxID=39481 RepID=A0A2G7HEB6_9CLOT|nr:YcaO-like family protein [Clostridium combesii]PIH03066.1 hypothetical protein CS538_14450 [Clostridium combesii]